MLECCGVRVMVRNKVMPAAAAEEEHRVYTIPMDSSGIFRVFDSDGTTLEVGGGGGGGGGGQFPGDLCTSRAACAGCKSAAAGGAGGAGGAGSERVHLRRASHSSVMTSRGRGLLCRLAIDLPLLAVVITLLLLLEFGYIPLVRSGFYCKDKSLDYKFVKDTVSMQVIVLSTVLFPLLMMWPVEAALHRPTEYALKSRRWKTSLVAAALLYRDYVYGLVLNLVTVEIMKLTIANPRPTFFDICQPDVNANCTEGEFVYEYRCTSQKYSSWFILDASRSFPSGHTSLAVYCGLFIAWYLQRRTFSWRNRSLVAVPLLQLLCVAYAVVCSLTRITDHRHHWWDVLTGAVVGVVVLLYTVLVLCKNFACAATVSSSDISSSESSGHNHHSVRRLLSSGSAEHALPHAHIAHVP